LTVREDKIYIHCRVAGHRLLIDVYEYVSSMSDCQWHIYNAWRTR